jgi:hypothetical protein
MKIDLSEKERAILQLSILYLKTTNLGLTNNNLYNELTSLSIKLENKKRTYPQLKEFVLSSVK